MSDFYIPQPSAFNGPEGSEKDFFVYTGTIYGEIRGGSTPAKQNVAQAILNRHSHAIVSDSTVTVADICLANKQFSCWNSNDPNRAEILRAATVDPKIWETCAQIAWAALGGQNPNRIDGARNYYATWMKIAPPWAKPPAVVTLNDGFHIFIRL